MNPYVSDPDFTLLVGDAVEALREVPDGSVHAALTSPPFYALRDYGVEGQIGLEDTPEEWAERLVEVFREVRRVLRDDGTLWVECGDSYAASSATGHGGWDGNNKNPDGSPRQNRQAGDKWLRSPSAVGGLKPKDLIGAPFLLAFALRADGWYWRGTYIWEKPDCMPESATDRCTTAHSYVFHFSKRARYFHDRDAIREPFSEQTSGGRQTGAGARYAENGAKGYDAGRVGRFQGPSGIVSEPSAQLDLDGNLAEPEQRGPDGRRVLTVKATHNSEQHRDGDRWPSPEGRNARSVWRIATEATSFGLCPVCRTYWDTSAPATHCGVDVVAHFATWPHELAGKIIACATSEAGCCAECGAPRVRETEVERPADQTDRQRRITRSQGNGAPSGMGGTSSTTFGTRGPVVTTIGWRPSCDCDAPTESAVILDPFAGSGTTARQARVMGRRSILVELSPDYAEIASHRLSQLSLLAEGAA